MSIAQMFLIVVALGLVGVLAWQLTAEDKPRNSDPATTSSGETSSSGPDAGAGVTSGGTDISQPTRPVLTGPDRPAPPRDTRPQEGVETEIAGIVSDEEGLPIEGATVMRVRYTQNTSNPALRIPQRFVEQIHERTQTNASGEYIFKDLPPQELWYIKATAPGYLTKFKDTVAAGKLADFRLERGVPVEVTIKDAATDEPVKGAWVKAYFKRDDKNHHRYFRWEEKATTGDDGLFRIAGAPVGQVQFLVFHDRYEDLNEMVAVNAGRTNQVTLTLSRGVTVRGRVYDLLTEEPLAGVRVETTASLLPEKSVETNANGEFEIAGLKRGPQRFTLRRSQYSDQPSVVQIGDGDDWSEERQNWFEFRMAPCGKAAGQIVGPDGRPVANAKVFVALQNPFISKVRGDGQPEMRTDVDGRFLVGDLGVDQEWKVIAHSDSIGFGVSETISVGPAEIRDGFVIRLSEGGEIRGRVLDENDQPIADALVEIDIPPYAEGWFMPGMGLGQQSTRTLVTEADGSYRFDKLWRGTFTFRVSSPKHIPLEPQKVVLASHDQVEERDFMLKIGRFLSGHLVVEGDVALDKVQVVVSRGPGDPSPRRVTADDTGAWRADALTSGNYSVWAETEGYTSERLERVPADSMGVNLTLRRNGLIAGYVVLPDGRPAQSFTVSVAPFFGTSEEDQIRAIQQALPARGVRDEGGRFAYENLPTGRYIVSISHQEGAPVTVEDVFVPVGQPADVGMIRLTKGAVLTGRITNTQGEPLGIATVTLTNTDNRAALGMKAAANGADTAGGGGGFFGSGQFAARPDENGVYRLSGMPPGKYRLEVEAPGYVAPAAEVVVLAEGQEVSKDFIMPQAARVFLSVQDDQGQPVVAAMVQVRLAGTGGIVRPSGGPPRTNTEGQVEIGGLAPGVYKLIVSRSGYLSNEVQVTVREGGASRETVVIEKLL